MRNLEVEVRDLEDEVQNLGAEILDLRGELRDVECDLEDAKSANGMVAREILDALAPVLQRCWYVDRSLVEYCLRRLEADAEEEVGEEVGELLFKLACGRVA